MHHQDSETVKPLLVAIVAAAGAHINEMLGTVSLSLSIAYTLFKFYKEKKK
jgi:hypothetical protein